MKQMLQSSRYSMVLVWPGCGTELMCWRLLMTAIDGYSLGVMFWPDVHSTYVSADVSTMYQGKDRARWRIGIWDGRLQDRLA